MRLSEWQAAAPTPESLAPRVEAAVALVLVGLGAPADAECWVLWGDDPSMRWLVFAPTPAGLLEVNVRVNVPQEGPRASGKLVRWGRVHFGDLQMDTQGGHRLLSFQLETQVLRAVDVECDRLSAFILALFALVDGRAGPEAPPAGVAGGVPARPGRRS